MLLAHPDKISARRSAPRGADRRRAAARDFHDRRFARQTRRSSGARTTFSSPIAWKRATWMPPGRSADVIVEGEYRTGAQEQLYIENKGMIAVANPARRRHRVGLAAMSVLRAQGADAAVRLARGKDSRDPGGNRRRIRRQGRISVDDRGARGAAGVEIREAA